MLIYFIFFVFLIFLLFIMLKLKIIILIDNNIQIKIYLFRIFKIIDHEVNKDKMKKIFTKTQRFTKHEFYRYIKGLEIIDSKRLIKNIITFLQKIKYEEIRFNLNINTKDYILNSYINAFLNIIIACKINKNINNINMNNLDYNITTNNTKTNFKLKCIIHLKFTNIIITLLRILNYIFKIQKRGKDGKGTSNRKFNGNCNVITRING